VGITSENVAAKYGVSRAQQDAMAVESHRRALQAQKEGRFNNEVSALVT
jgi:acetyl-CoA acyltransferase 1